MPGPAFMLIQNQERPEQLADDGIEFRLHRKSALTVDDAGLEDPSSTSKLLRS